MKRFAFTFAYGLEIVSWNEKLLEELPNPTNTLFHLPRNLIEAELYHWDKTNDVEQADEKS